MSGWLVIDVVRITLGYLKSRYGAADAQLAVECLKGGNIGSVPLPFFTPKEKPLGEQFILGFDFWCELGVGDSEVAQSTYRCGALLHLSSLTNNPWESNSS